MAELEDERTMNFLARDAARKNVESATAVNNATAELQTAVAAQTRARAKRTEAQAALLLIAAFVLALLAIGWSAWAWAVLR
jgi:hypothetical protein